MFITTLPTGILRQQTRPSGCAIATTAIIVTYKGAKRPDFKFKATGGD